MMQVPSLNAIVSMVGIIFFRRVVLEDGEGLAAKIDQLYSILNALGWPLSTSTKGRGSIGSGLSAGRLLAACLDPPAKAMLAALHQAADGGGELRANFQVRRSAGAAFWDAKQQAEEEGLITPTPGVKPRSFKVFPSFVDEWAAVGGQQGGGKPKLEAGEGHGPRKEFFALAAASMTGQSATADAGGPPDAAPSPRQQQQPRPHLFTFNRSAGAFWYNSTLTCSPELQAAFRFSGWLVGQSLLNKVRLFTPFYLIHPSPFVPPSAFLTPAILPQT